MKQPDIEIYLLACPTETLVAWLASRFSIRSRKQESPTQWVLHLEHDNHLLPVTILEQAAGKKFTSLWFDSENTPWATDIECAREAFSELGFEVRCNAQGWQEEGNEDPDQWWRINKQGEGLFIWK